MSATAGEPSSPAVPKRPRKRRGRIFDWMALPALVVLAAVIGYPIVKAIQLSFTNTNLLSSTGAHSVGFSNYDTLFNNDPVFWQALEHTMVYTFVSVAVAGLIGLLLALATENLGGAWRFVRTLMLAPWGVPVIVVAFLFYYMFQDRGGIVNETLVNLGLVHTPVHWLTSGNWALVAVIVANVWSITPFFLLMFTAALASVPNEVIEAARVDRAGTLGMLTRIKLPYLRTAALLGTLLMVIQNFNNFPLIYSMTKGGPVYSTTTLVIYVYQLAFSQFHLGFASAVGVIWLIILLVFAGMFIRLMRTGNA
ncbi:MAG TPA: sugar ABC transporter permease [Acidimicrobiales bacterium]|nr:sugar ABC transporter permease [Acidimicrobiales bacterium]